MTALISVFIALLQQPAFLPSTPGEFRYDAWEGHCLSVVERPEFGGDACLVWYLPHGKPAAVMVEIDRKKDSFLVRAKARRCAMEITRQLDNVALSAPDRVRRLADVLATAWTEVSSRCGIGAPVPSWETEPLAKLLTRTDGIVN